MKLKHIFRIFLPCIFIVGCSQSVPTLVRYDPSAPAIKVDLTYDMINTFKPGAYFDPAVNMDEVAKMYHSQSLLERLLFHTEKWRKTPYKLGGISHEKGADCSAFTQQVMHQAYGVNLSRSTFYQRKEGRKVATSKLKTGDLLFFRTGGPNGLHVGIYMQNGQFIHLSEHGGARVQNLRMNYWAKRFLEARRYFK